MSKEHRLQKEIERHFKELDAIQNGKDEISKEDEFIDKMREMNKTVSGDSDSKEEINSTYYSTLVNNGH